jgi:D-glycero-D-manno-heptose 1,7-bisphosphate phosphatase
MARPRKAAFLDRDGVINRECDYLYRVSDFEFLPGALQGLRQLSELGFLLAVVTNQSGIARGLYTETDYSALTEHMVAELASHGVTLAGIRHCPHLPEASMEAYRCDCNCRKPKPGMVLDLAKRLDVDLSASILVGDKLSDLQAGRAAGVARCYLVRSGHPLTESGLEAADAVFDDLAACAGAMASLEDIVAITTDPFAKTKRGLLNS